MHEMLPLINKVKVSIDNCHNIVLSAVGVKGCVSKAAFSTVYKYNGIRFVSHLITFKALYQGDHVKSTNSCKFFAFMHSPSTNIILFTSLWSCTHACMYSYAVEPRMYK